MGGGTSLKGPSIDTIYESTRYSLDNEWNLFESYDRKASTLLASSTTIISIYIAINIFISSIIKKPDLIFSQNGYSYLLVIVIIVIFVLATSYFIMNAIWSAIECLNIVEFIRTPNPIELSKSCKTQTELVTKVAIIKSMMKTWSRNHDFFNVDKARCLRKSLNCLKTGIIFLIVSFAVDWILIIVYNLFYAGG